MDSSLTPPSRRSATAILKVCDRFGDDYWLARDKRRRLSA